MAWIFRLAAEVREVGWAFFMKQSRGFARLRPSGITLVAMMARGALLALPRRALPLGAA